MARDYACGGRTYDGHDGTDIRIPNLEIQKKGVEVVAAASGRVARVRDGVDDISVRTIGKAAIIGKECGNGAVIEHENGWQTNTAVWPRAACESRLAIPSLRADQSASLDCPGIPNFLIFISR